MLRSEFTNPDKPATRRFPFAAALAAFWGGMRLAMPTALTAVVRLDPVILPAGIELDPAVVADQLTEQLTAQAGRDVAIHMTLGAENLAELTETALPRLVSPSAIGRMIDRIPPLEDVALTLPGSGIR